MFTITDISKYEDSHSDSADSSSVYDDSVVDPDFMETGSSVSDEDSLSVQDTSKETSNSLEAIGCHNSDHDDDEGTPVEIVSSYYILFCFTIFNFQIYCLLFLTAGNI